jgi:hypothetical protein
MVIIYLFENQIEVPLLLIPIIIIGGAYLVKFISDSIFKQRGE